MSVKSNRDKMRQQLSDIPTMELIRECERRVQEKVPTLVSQIQEAITELNSLGISVYGESYEYSKFSCSTVSYNLNDKEVIIDLV